MEKYKARYRVRVSDSDSIARVKLSALLSLMQEAATDDAERIGVGRRRLLSMGLGWALSKLSLTILRLPVWGEHITVETWPSRRTRISTEREFVVRDDGGQILATARTLWVLFNLKERRIERLEVLGQWPAVEDFADNTEFERPRLPAQEGVLCSDFGVRKDDIDLNGHVNNAVYITWAMEPLSREFCLSHEPSHIAIWFLNEVIPGERVESLCSIQGAQTLHLLRSGGVERARVGICWQPYTQKES